VPRPARRFATSADETTLRHTCVTLLLDLGAPPCVVREIVGHSDIEVTMTIYAVTRVARREAQGARQARERTQLMPLLPIAPAPTAAVSVSAVTREWVIQAMSKH
jgi:hypothetical protein